jgi:hypothetical protein
MFADGVKTMRKDRMGLEYYSILWIFAPQHFGCFVLCQVTDRVRGFPKLHARRDS